MRSRDFISLVKRAYKKTGLTPLTRSYGSYETGSACPITTLNAMNRRYKYPQKTDTRYLSKKYGLPADFWDGLICGVDDWSWQSVVVDSQDKYRGFLCGKKLRAWILDQKED